MTEPVPSEPELEPELALEQHVVVDGGYALAAIGADVWLLDEPAPQYALAPWPPSAYAAHDAPGDSSPSVALADLAAWLESEPLLALRWLSGADSPYRRSLVEQLAETATAAGWRVLTAVPRPSDGDPRPAAPAATTVPNPGGVLVIVDRADQQSLTYLDWLLSNALLHQPGRNARVLLVAPNGDAWPSLRASLTRVQASNSWQRPRAR